MTKKHPKTRFQKVKAEIGERRCLVTGVPKLREQLIRFVLGPDNVVYPDLAERLEGRGVWISANKFSLQTAISKRLFNKGFCLSVKVPEDLPKMVENGLKKRALDLLGLANKAGFLELGFEKIKEAASKEEMLLLIEALDGSEAEKKRLQVYLPQVPVISLFSRTELGFEMGREACVHIAVKKSKMTLTLQKEMMRLNAFLNEGNENE